MIAGSRAVLAVALGAHFLHEGLADIVYVLLPVWARELRLSFPQVGMLRTAYSGGMALFQIPAGLLAERRGERRVPVAGVGGALALVFAGGAAGKFVCGLVAERLGVIRTVVLTEAATAAGIVTVLVAPLPVALPVLPVLGVALDGTSSALHGSVADLVTPEGRARAYGLYYTLAIGSSAVAPTLSGMLSDVAGVPVTLLAVAGAAVATIPLCFALRATAVAAEA